MIDDSTDGNGKSCPVLWTNSFAQISSILERNAREHDASLVLFTGDERIDLVEDSPYESLYQKIKYSDCNFRVSTLDGVDSEKDGISPVVGKYNGKKHGDLPPTYVLGDSAAYKQTLPDVNVGMAAAFDFDLEYPESEYVKGSSQM